MPSWHEISRGELSVFFCDDHCRGSKQRFIAQVAEITIRFLSSFFPQRVYKLRDDVDLLSHSFSFSISLPHISLFLSLSLSLSSASRPTLFSSPSTADKVRNLFSDPDLILNGGKLYRPTLFSSNRLIKTEIPEIK
jgi:hypothetical protein